MSPHLAPKIKKDSIYFSTHTVHYKVTSGHREKFSTFFKPFQLLPPDCLPESSVSIDSESVIQIKIGSCQEILEAPHLGLERS